MAPILSLRGSRFVPALAAVLVCSVLAGVMPAAGQEGGNEDLAGLTGQLGKIETLLESYPSLRDWDRDGLNSRIDQLALDLIEALHRQARGAFATADPGEADREPLVHLLDQSAALALDRVDVLEQRAATERELFAKFEQSPQADIARVFVADLRQLRLDYLSAMADQRAIRREAGLRSNASCEAARERVKLIVEQLTGQIRLDALSLRKLRAQLDAEPQEEDLQHAQALVHEKQSRNLDTLDRIIPTAERFGLSITEQSSLLISERGRLGVEILQRDVFSRLRTDKTRALRKQWVQRGPDLVFRCLLFLLLLIVAWMAARLVRLPVRMLVHRERLKMSRLLRSSVVSLASAMVFLVGVVIALASLGIGLGHLFAGLGVLSILVGLAIQDSLGNLAAGFMILIYRPYDVDDHISASGAEGYVKRMNLLATSIVTFDNQLLVVPNRQIWGGTIVNYTAHHTRRVDIKVCFAYTEDLDRVRQVLMSVLEEHEQVLKKPEPVVHMSGMEDSALSMMAKPWVRTEDYWATRWDLIRRIKQRFDAEGIEIPFPQRVVTLRNDGQEARSGCDST